MKAKRKLIQPSDPYDTKAWLEFYAENPGFRRSVGAEGVNDESNDGDDDDGESNDDNDEDAGGKPDDNSDDKSGKPTDAEARLIKDIGKAKAAKKKAEQDLSELQERFKGIDPDEVRALMEERAEAKRQAEAAEQEKLVAAGDFEKVKAQIVEQHETALAGVQSQLEAAQAENAKLRSEIEDLTIGSSFTASKFIDEKTVLTANKARRLYGDHFDIVEGNVVGYDKPRGQNGRVELVDASGEPVTFEAAMERIIDSDPEKDDLLRASIKPGADSSPSAAKGGQRKAPAVSGREKISQGVGDLVRQMNEQTPDTFKL